MRSCRGCSWLFQAPSVLGSWRSGWRATTASPWLTVCSSTVAPTRTPATIHNRMDSGALSMAALLLRPSESFQDRVTDKHQNEGRQKNHPARKFMKETFGRLWAEVIRQHASSHDSNRVADDGNGNHQNHQRVAHPAPRFHQIAISHRQRNERHQGPDAAARFHDLERIVGQYQHVSFTQHRDLDYFQPEGCEARCNQLQRKGYLIVNDH